MTLALGAAAHQAYLRAQADGYTHHLERVWCITTLGPSGEPGVVLIADRVNGARGMSWSFTTAGPMWRHS